MAIKKSQLWAAAASMALSATAAQAGVVYNWSQVSDSPTIDSSSGRIEVTDTAWVNGSLDARYTNFVDGVTPTPVPDSQLLDFSFTVNGTNTQVVPRNPGSAPGDEPEFDISLGLRFNRGDPLAGSIDSLTTTNQIALSGDPLWTIARFGSDEGPEACFTEGPQCFGATGMWVVDESTFPIVVDNFAVAEPPAVLLFLGSVIGIALVCGRRRGLTIGPANHSGGPLLLDMAAIGIGS